MLQQQIMGALFLISTFAFADPSDSAITTNSNVVDTNALTAATADVSAPITTTATLVPTESKRAIYSKRLEPYFTDFAHDFKNSMPFTCPGDSFITGVRSRFLDGDRQFAYTCTFLENAKKQVLKKSECKALEKPDFVFGTSGSSQCAPHSFIDTFNSIYGQDKKRAIGTGCCKVTDWNNKLFIADKSCKIYRKVHQVGEAFHFLCETDKVISKIEATVEGADQVFSFTCCSLSQ